ncbi:hypothetical protein KS419_20165 [Bacillus tamaricis]|uniref:Uncharacterized protein n=1 Tax=Evansella tamaricis TaxID=2069301 RepID=A0ABS6JLG8_9BACI|nr:hypothetical protein [Evansella tamaricis]MBU9714054.1 hypothetical protein [Evansella tamaricis]
MWLALIIGLAVLMVVFSVVNSIKNKRTNKEGGPEESERSCKTCMKEIPSDFSKALCPHCKNFLT